MVIPLSSLYYLSLTKYISLQIFPINIKGSAGSLVTVVNWFGSWVVSYAFNFLMKWSSEGPLSHTHTHTQTHMCVCVLHVILLI
ncbi:putative MFS transporter superfamily [Helianthus annuus]|nr:putative MFS transporter superfamily [Helianthus annuus]